MTTFLESSADYLGPTVTPRHIPTGERTFTVCGRDGCEALVASDESHRGDAHLDNYDGRHQWNVRRRSPRGGSR